MDSMALNQKPGSVGGIDSPADKSPSPLKLKDVDMPLVHSTPMPSSDYDKDKEDLDSSLLTASPPLGRKSGRARKKTEKGAAFNDTVNKKAIHEPSAVVVKSVANSSDQASAEPSAAVTGNVSSPPRKRGHPRKSEAVGGDIDSKEIAEDSGNIDISENVSNQVCKRGRPRKSETVSHDIEPQGNAKNSRNTQSTIDAENVADPLKKTSGSTVQSVDVSLNVPAPPRKRGRPRKSDVVSHESRETAENSDTVQSTVDVKSMTDPSDKNVANQSVPRKRGRPRKSDVVSHESRETVENSDTVQSTVDANQSVPRKRGRPGKSATGSGNVKASEDAEDIGSTLSAADVNNGADPSEETEEENAENSVNAQNTADIESTIESRAEDQPQTVTKRKRGRPKKQRPLVPETCPKSLELSEIAPREEEEPKERRSSRKKQRPAWSYEEEEEEESAEEGVKKSGLSRKTTSHQKEEDEPEEEEEEIIVVRKKRGRKPKAKKPEEDESAHPHIEACLRCGEKMASLGSYKYHLVSKHAALYSKECPEGEQTHGAIRQILLRFKHVNCPGCRKVFRFTQYFLHHLKWCGREKEKVICSTCGHKVMAMWMEQHNRDHRKKEAQMAAQKEVKCEVPEEGTASGNTKRRAATASLLKMKAVAQDNYDFLEGGPKKRRNKPKHDDDWEGKEQDEDEGDDNDDDQLEESGSDVDRLPSGRGGDARRIFYRVPDSFEEHRKFLEKLPKEKLFPSLLPRRAEWTPLSESESARYLPTTRESVPVSIKRGKVKRTEPAVLQWGESICDNKQGTAFVGGSIWSVEWCPLDEEVGRREQVMAVSASREAWGKWLLNKQGEGPGSIQFWTTGSLEEWGPNKSPSLKLSFCLAHDFLHVLSMAWCPRRAFHDSLTESADALPRLGLLAVAGYNSHVTVYSVPTPEALEGCESETKGKNSNPPTFKPAPTLTLLCSAPEVAGACLTVAWQKADDCDFIAGGYAKGFVHLWHISSTSPLVRRSDDTLAAIRMFYAHYGVMSVDWSWLMPTQFATGSLENEIRLWDLKDTRTPLVVFPDNIIWEKGPTRAVTFGSSIYDCVIFADDQRDGSTGGVYALDLSLGLLRGADAKKASRFLCRHAATVWDIGYSPWFNMVGSGDNTGLLYLSSGIHIQVTNIKGYARSRQGVTVFSTTCTQRREAQKEDRSIEEEGTSEDDITSAEGLHITFNDENMQEDKDFIKTGREESTTRQYFHSFKSADINSVCFNPNKMSSMWLACGTRAGFLRLLHLPCLALQSRAAKDFFKLKKTLH